MKVLLLLFLAACGDKAVSPKSQYYLVSMPSGELQRGFGVAVAEVRGDLIRSRSGRMIPIDHLQAARPVGALGTTRMDLAYVIERDAGVWAHPDDGERPIATHALFDRVALSSAPVPPGWRALAGGFMRASETRAPERTARPAEVSPGERWIDVDTAREILTVYDGEEPIFVTLVSTGQGRPGTHYSTPRGVYRVEYKVPSAKMDNVDEGGDPPYSFEDVPWVQYFHKEVAIHGAYWHQRFGHPVSHGCVNLTPADAERVYALTRASTPAYPGTVVRVR